MARRLQPGDPVVDIDDAIKVDVGHGMGGNGIEPLGQLVPALLHQPVFGIALVRRVREQQLHRVVERGHLADPRFPRAMAEQADAVLLFLEPLVQRRDLRVAQFGVGNVESIVRTDQSGEAIGLRAHILLLALVAPVH